jgi:hypothetical protein
MEDSTSCYVMWERRLLARFPCISPGLSARCTLPLKDPEPPRKSPNLSPKPIPKIRAAEPLTRIAHVRGEAPGRSPDHRRKAKYRVDASQSLIEVGTRLGRPKDDRVRRGRPLGRPHVRCTRHLRFFARASVSTNVLLRFHRHQFALNVRWLSARHRNELLRVQAGRRLSEQRRLARRRSRVGP